MQVGSLMDTMMPGTWTIANLTMPGQAGTPLNQSGASFTIQLGVRRRSAAASAVPVVPEHARLLHSEDEDEIVMIAESATEGASVQVNLPPPITHFRAHSPCGIVCSCMGALSADISVSCRSILTRTRAPRGSQISPTRI